MKPITLHYRYKNQIEKKETFSVAEILIGRTEKKKNTLPLLKRSISRQHCKLYHDFSTWYVKDLKSSSGTYVNDQEIIKPTELFPNDILGIGDYTIRVEFDKTENIYLLETIDSSRTASETIKPESLSEKDLLEIYQTMNRIISEYKSRDSMLDRFMEMLNDFFPQANRKSILIKEDREFLPLYVGEGNRSYASFTLARKSIREKKAFRWTPPLEMSGNYPQLVSWEGALSAIYAPIYFRRNPLGAVHLETTSSESDFSNQDIELLAVIANGIGRALQAESENLLSDFPSIFLSHSKEDNDFTATLAKQLRKRQIRTYLYDRVKSGKEYNELVSNAIHSSNAFGIVLSDFSIKSQQVQKEFQIARSCHRKILVIQPESCNTPKELERYPIITYPNRLPEESIYEIIDHLNEEKIRQNIMKKENVVNILIFAANPNETQKLDLDKEVERIETNLLDAIEDANTRFKLFPIYATRPNDLVPYLIKQKPHIVHFSGHGSTTGEIMLEDESNSIKLVGAETLRRLFRLVSEDNENLRCVVLNACYTETQAKAIGKVIDCVIGMDRAVSDEAAIHFATGFYRAIGSGKDINRALKEGRIEVELHSPEEAFIPKYYFKPGVDPSEITFG